MTPSFDQLDVYCLSLPVGVPAPNLGSPSARVKYSELEKRVAQNRTLEGGADSVAEGDGASDSKRSFTNPLFDNSEIFLRVSNLKPESSVTSSVPASQKKR